MENEMFKCTFIFNAVPENARIQMGIDVLVDTWTISQFRFATFYVSPFHAVCIFVMAPCINERCEFGVTQVASHIKIFRHESSVWIDRFSTPPRTIVRHVVLRACFCFGASVSFHMNFKPSTRI